MGLADRIRRVFATTGSNINTPKDEPRSYGAGIIRRLKLTNNYGNRNYEQHIGDNRTYMNVFLSDPIVRSLIDLPCLYAVKDGFDIVTEDEKLRDEITKTFVDINIDTTIYGWLRNSRIFGSGYLEWTGDNLVLRSSQNMFVKRNEHGQLMYYYQSIGDDKEDVRFEPDEIIELQNNPFDDYAYGLSDIHTILYLVDLKDYAERDIGAALNKYAVSRFDISCGLPDMPYGPDKINEIVDAFNALEPGEDIIHGNDIQIKEIEGSDRAFEYGKYTDDILDKIHIALKVPRTMWTAPEQARPIFDDAFTKAKTDMIYLSEGVLAPGEVRSERGLDAEGIVEQRPTEGEVNISGGKNQDKKAESQRTEQRLSKNQKGKRTDKEEVVEVVA